jgi:hypothetical protein
VPAHVVELAEARVRRLLVLDAVRGDRVVGDVLEVRVAEVEERVEDGGGDRLDPRVLVLLDRVQGLEQAPVVVHELADVVEHVRHERLQPLRRHDRRVRRLQRLDVHLRRGGERAIHSDDGGRLRR